MIPNKIILIGEIYSVKKVTQEEMDNKFDGDGEKGTLGKIIPKDKIIYLVKDQDEEDQENTFFHELGHYFNVHYCIKDSEAMAQAIAEFWQKINGQMGKNEWQNKQRKK